MDAVLFLATFACLVVVSVWYLENQIRNADGDVGWLALKEATDDDTLNSPRYQPRNRTDVKNSGAAAAEGAPRVEARASYKPRRHGAYQATTRPSSGRDHRSPDPDAYD